MKTNVLIGMLIVLNTSLLGLLLVRDRNVASAGAMTAPTPVVATAANGMTAEPAAPTGVVAFAPTTTVPTVPAQPPAARPVTPEPRPAPEPPPPAAQPAEREPEPVWRPAEPRPSEPEPVWRPAEPAIEPAVEPQPERTWRPRPVQVDVRPGTVLPVTLTYGIHSRDVASGDSFSARLAEDLVVDGQLVARAGSDVEGVVIDRRLAGRVEGTESLTLGLVGLRPDNAQTYDIATSTATFEAQKTTKKDAITVGGAAAVGAIIGAIAKGKKGAATGAATGAAAGSGVVLATRGDAVKLDANTRLTFTLERSLRLPELRDPAGAPDADEPEHWKESSDIANRGY